MILARKRPLAAALGALLLALLPASPARAYETDQLTARQVTPFDASVELDAYVNAALERARARAERRLQRGASPERVGRILRRQIIREFPFDYLFFGAPIEEWMAEDLARVGYAVETDGPGSRWERHIYDRYPRMFRMNPFEDLPTPALVFALATAIAGTPIAPTYVSADGVRYGADKWSHFFRLGYRYWTRSDGGRDEAKAIRLGTRSERHGIGYWTSGAFSYADLAANYDGYRFFRAVLADPGAPEQDPYFAVEGDRLVWRRPFRSADYVSEDWDEYLNPCFYRPHLQRIIELHLEEERARVCAEYEAWREQSGAPRAPLREPEGYADPARSPPAPDPFRLAERCAEGAL